MSTRDSSLAAARALAVPAFCISRRILMKVFRTSVDALGTYRKVGSRIDFIGPPIGCSDPARASPTAAFGVALERNRNVARSARKRQPDDLPIACRTPPACRVEQRRVAAPRA